MFGGVFCLPLVHASVKQYEISKSITQNSFRSLLEFSVVWLSIILWQAVHQWKFSSLLIQNPLCPTYRRYSIWIQYSACVFRNYPKSRYVVPDSLNTVHLLLSLQPWPQKWTSSPSSSAVSRDRSALLAGDIPADSGVMKSMQVRFFWFEFNVQWFQLWPSISL